LWNYLDIASLRPGNRTVAFTSLTDTTNVVTLGEHRKEDNEEKEYFAMAADYTAGMDSRSRDSEPTGYGRFHYLLPPIRTIEGDCTSCTS
jgi:hypothetical protein